MLGVRHEEALTVKTFGPTAILIVTQAEIEGQGAGDVDIIMKIKRAVEALLRQAGREY
jgi:hypothetical protein